MTSKISFSKMVRTEFRQLTWLVAVQTVLYLLLVPFRALMAMSAETSGEVLRAADKLDILSRHIGINRFENVLVVLVAGIVCALCAFSYVHSPVKLDLYHSLPVKRERLFEVKYLASVLTFAIPYALAQVLALAVGALYGVVSKGLTLDILVMYVQHLLFFLCSYAGTVLAIMMTGKILTSICAVGVFVGYLPLLYALRGGFKDAFFITDSNFYHVNFSNSILKYSSPWTFCVTWGNGAEVQNFIGPTGRWPSMGGICQLIAIAAILTLIAVALYRIRKSEVAGSALAFRRTEGIVKVMITIPVGLVAALVANISFHSLIWEVVFIVLFSVLACMLMEFIYRWDIRQVLMHKSHIAVTVMVAAAVFFSCRYDVFHYNTYLPEFSELESMAVIGSDALSHEYPSGDEEGSYVSVYENTKEMLTNFESDQIEKLYPLAENSVANVQRRKANGWQWVYNGNETEWIHLKYHLKNGKEVYRFYEVDRELYASQMAQIMEDEAYREKYFPILTWQPAEVDKISYYYYEGSVPELDQAIAAAKGEAVSSKALEEKAAETAGKEYSADELDDEFEVSDTEWAGEGKSIYVPQSRTAEMLEAYQKDLRELSYDKIFESGPWLNFARDDQKQTYQSDSYPMNGNFSNTIALLAEFAAETF